jgi:hypothetical protein
MRGRGQLCAYAAARRALPSALAPVALVIVLAFVLAGCGAAAVSPTPIPSPRPTPTPDPHLDEPASVGDVYTALNAAGLRVVANNADAGAPGGEPRKRVNSTYAGWPLILSEYSSAEALAEYGFQPDTEPALDEAPFSIAGLNILVEFGPHAKNEQVDPDRRFLEAAQALVDALHPLVGPLSQSSVEPLDLPAPSRKPGSSPAPSPSAPVASPSS